MKDIVLTLKDVRVIVPAAVKRGENVNLICQYDLEGDTLYSLKWYKGKREFFRFTPKKEPSLQTFPVPGIYVELSMSSVHKMKNFNLFASIFCFFIVQSYYKVLSITIECQFYTGGWIYLGESIYTCYMKSNEAYTNGRVTIDSIDTAHRGGKTNYDVKGFISLNTKTIEFIPTSLEKVFKNLISIRIDNSNLRDIRKENLKAYPLLKGLYLYRNKIEVIRVDLFQYNPNLEVIFLEDNKIAHIEPQTFKNLNKIRVLMLSYNLCKDFFGFADTREETLKLIQTIDNGTCISDQFTSESFITPNVIKTNERFEKLQENEETILESLRKLKNQVEKLTVEIATLSRQQNNCENSCMVSKVENAIKESFRCSRESSNSNRG
ncbi:hypothetical protein PVAND_005307 [Polypedilum vanderplanki]|uniref:Uncharacterized protein n=1 Tax=Polypedilum vanderplanki TaxID=319348 RepID=A0A9J6C004_POLVA|nr:hypothetical protein PVAND_005307 [Polypedilum vanderplanki]